MLGRSVPTDNNGEPLQDGIYFNVPDAEYRDWDCFSYSMIKSLIISPKHFLNNHKNFKPTEVMELGNIFETELLEPEKMSEVCRQTPDKAPNAKDLMVPFSLRVPKHREILQEYRDGGYIPVFPETMSKVKKMVQSVKTLKHHKKYLFKGQAQVSLLWTCRDTGIRCKARLDVYNPQINNVTDVKTTSSAFEENWRTQIGRMYYHCQAAHYLSGLDHLLSGGQIFSWTFVVVENEEPYGARIFHLRPGSVCTGAETVGICKRIYKEIQDIPEEEWPCYPVDEEIDIDIRPYLLRSDVDDMGEGEGVL